MATQIFAGLDGMANQIDPGGPLNDDPYGQAGMELLPSSLMDSIDALDRSAMSRAARGDDFVVASIRRWAQADGLGARELSTPDDRTIRFRS